jgi:arginine decarboxylase-like protein
MAVKVGTIQHISDVNRAVKIDEKTYYLSQALFNNIVKSYHVGDYVEIEYEGTKVKNFVKKNNLALGGG